MSVFMEGGKLEISIKNARSKNGTSNELNLQVMGGERFNPTAFTIPPPPAPPPTLVFGWLFELKNLYIYSRWAKPDIVSNFPLLFRWKKLLLIMGKFTICDQCNVYTNLRQARNNSLILQNHWPTGNCAPMEKKKRLFMSCGRMKTTLLSIALPPDMTRTYFPLRALPFLRAYGFNSSPLRLLLLSSKEKFAKPTDLKAKSSKSSKP